MKASRRNVIIGVAGAAVAQGAAYLLYRKITGDRAAAGGSKPFDYEVLDGESRGQEARLQRRDGTELTLGDTRGAPLLLHFWATWCEPCRAELPQLLQLATPPALLVSVDESWLVIDHFFSGKRPREVVLDARHEARRAFAVTTLPDTYLLSPRGRPLARFHGPQQWDSAETIAALQRLSG